MAPGYFQARGLLQQVLSSLGIPAEDRLLANPGDPSLLHPGRSAQVVMDRETGGSKGFGFVEMADDQAAQAAISAMHDRDVDGRRLVVNEARPREERPGGFGGGGRR